MSEFFKNYNKFYYNMDKVKPVRGILATNLMSRVNINNKVLKNISSYYSYRIKESERPDIIATQYYGSPDYTYLIFLANQIQDPLYDWPLFGNDLTKFIEDKYDSLDAARTGIHHYEKTLRNSSDKTADTNKILEKVAIVNKETYDALEATERKIIYNYDYEIMKNNEKKDIILIENTYSKQIMNELRAIYDN
jgi:hypothetical protein